MHTDSTSSSLKPPKKTSLGGRGRGRGTPGRVLQRRWDDVSQDDASSEHPCLYVIYYMLGSGSFTAACLQTIPKGVLDPRLTWSDTCAPRASTTRRPSHVLKTVKGLLLLVPPRTPRSSGYDVYAHTVYVVICYMSIICYMTVICLVQRPPQETVVVFGYIEGSFLVSRTACASECQQVYGTRNCKLGG